MQNGKTPLWYILHTYTGYEGKIERAIKSLIEKNEIDEFMKTRSKYLMY
mgnify:CR=1 FL=1